MTKNRIALVRKERGLTQRALADLAGTSQQQVQRIEAGIQGARLELAIKIASVLDVTLGEVFPSLKATGKRRSSETSRPTFGPADRANTIEAGIDPDPRYWTIKFFANDGRLFMYRVASDEKSRLESIFSQVVSEIVVFSTKNQCVALNPKRVAATQFLFDLGVVEPIEVDQEQYELKLHLVGTHEPIAFGIQPDEKLLQDDDEGYSSQLQRLFVDLDLGSDDEPVFFDNEDAERVCIRPSEFIALEVPLICCEPSLWRAHSEGFLEDEKEEYLHSKRATNDPD